MITRLEQKYIPNLRRHKIYKFMRFIILVPFLLPLHLLKKAYSSIRFKRKNKPDIVLENIVKGWINLMIHNSVSEEVAMTRANICAKCPLAEFSSGVHTVVVDRKTTHVRGMVCKGCGCPLSAKIRSPYEFCPLAKW